LSIAVTGVVVTGAVGGTGTEGDGVVEEPVPADGAFATGVVPVEGVDAGGVVGTLAFFGPKSVQLVLSMYFLRVGHCGRSTPLIGSTDMK
jgi:hypothetical protein